MADAAIGVFGGSGFYAFLDDVETVELDTPYGAPSGPISIGTVGDRRVAFVPRHGPRHTIAPARIPQRANLWAMRTLGVRSVVGPCAVGSLRTDVGPGDFVVLDQLVDRTRGRDDTFYDGEHVHHVSFADPYCPVLRAHAVEAAASGRRHHARGRHHRGDQRTALLDPCGVALVPRAGLGRRRHDAVPGGVPRARARHALHGHRVGDRLRHRRRGRPGHRAGHDGAACSRSWRTTSDGSSSSSTSCCRTCPSTRPRATARWPSVRSPTPDSPTCGKRAAVPRGLTAEQRQKERSLARRSGRATTDEPGICTDTPDLAETGCRVALGKHWSGGIHSHSPILSIHDAAPRVCNTDCIT